ncbi:MAG: hypothetical protein JXA97_03520 [Anaerolineales bacterium]|nr:hypothetical protein [Anaerolineales bacterium]
MAAIAVFSGLLVDDTDQFVETTTIGGEAFYIIDDDGFQRHIESEPVDREILTQIFAMMEGQEEYISENAMKMLGQEDIFTKAAIEQSLKKMDEQIDAMLKIGLPADTLTWLGMMGFRVTINYHGEVLEISQLGMIDPGEE